MRAETRLLKKVAAARRGGFFDCWEAAGTRFFSRSLCVDCTGRRVLSAFGLMLVKIEEMSFGVVTDFQVVGLALADWRPISPQALTVLVSPLPEFSVQHTVP